MQRLRKQIREAFYNIKLLCDQFFMKFPHYAYPYQSPYHPYNNVEQYPHSFNNRIMNQEEHNYYFNSQNTRFVQNKAGKKQSKQFKITQKKQQQKQKKGIQQKKIRQLRLQVKQKMRTDSRLKQKPKYPSSPYFRFLHQMRQKPQNQQLLKKSTNRVFTEQMGQRWRGMTEQQKSSYISGFADDKMKYDKNIKIFYQKYPDISPKWRLNQYEKQAKLTNNNRNYKNKNEIEDQTEENYFEQFTPDTQQNQLNNIHDSFECKQYQQNSENEQQNQQNKEKYIEINKNQINQQNQQEELSFND